MRILFACCVVACSAAFSSAGVHAGNRLASVGVLSDQSAKTSTSCSQCTALAEQYELLVARIATLRDKRKSLEARELSLINKHGLKQDMLLNLQSRYAKIQQDELALGASGKLPGSTNSASVKATRVKLVLERKKIEREEFEIRADLVTLGKAIPQAKTATRRGEQDLDNAIAERLTVMQAMTNCEQRCVIADRPGTLIFTASSLTDIAQSNRSAIRNAAQNSAACNDCNRLQEQIANITRQIVRRQQAETGVRNRMTDLDRQRQAIRNEWRDLYNRYSERLVVRLNTKQKGDERALVDRDLTRISEQIIDVNTRRQRLLTSEGKLQDQLMLSGKQRDQLGRERRRLRAALGACEELCVAGESDPVNVGIKLATRRINIAKAEAKCARCGSLARLVNDATSELGPLTTERDKLAARFARIAPALEQIQARRRSIIKYAGELADLMEEFRQSGDVARAKRELSQISTRSQRLSTDIIRILDQRESLEQQIDENADAITRLSILARQRRRQLADCESRCNAPNATADIIAMPLPDLTFALPDKTGVRCGRCATLGQIVDQLLLIRQSEQASLSVTEAQLKVHQARLVQADRALRLNTQSIRRARNNAEARDSSEHRSLIDGLQGEARVIRAERKKFLSEADGARAARNTIGKRISKLTATIRKRRQDLTTCETSCRIIADAPRTTLANAQSLIRKARVTSRSCKECSSRAGSMREIVADIRSDSAKLESAITSAIRDAKHLAAFSSQIASNRKTVLNGVRGWFRPDRSADGKRRIKTVIEQAFATTRLARKVEESATVFVTSAAARDNAQTGLAGTMPLLATSIKALEACAGTCEQDKIAEPPFNPSDYEENNPASLVVAAITTENVRTACAGCQTKARLIDRANRNHAAAMARIATSRNIVQSAERIKRRIAARKNQIRRRIAQLVKLRFLEQDTVRKTSLGKRIDALETENRKLDEARTKQDDRLDRAASDTDNARQDVRQIDREIIIAKRALRSCETTCEIATDESGEDPAPTVTGNGTDIARLPTQQAPSQPGNAGTDQTPERTAETRLPGTPESERESAETGNGKTIRASTTCNRCSVFARRINTLSEKLQALRGERKTAAGRIESRLQQLHASLASCESVCKAPQEVVASNDADPDSRDEGAGDSTSSETAVRPKRNSANRIVIADSSQPQRKEEQVVETAEPRVFGSIYSILAGGSTPSDGWKTTVDVAIGGGNVWVPESATLSVIPAAGGNGDEKLDAKTFAVTVSARHFDADGTSAVAWGTLEVIRGDTRSALNGGTRNTDYTRVRGTVGLGRDVFDCLENGGYCTVGLMAGVEHSSFDDRLAAALASQKASIDNTALLAGVRGEMRLPLGGFDATGIALILKGDAYLKGGYAWGKMAAAAISGITTTRTASGFVGAGADLAAELELGLGQGAIAIGGRIGVDTLPTISQNGGSVGIDNDVSTSATVYVRGTLKF